MTREECKKHKELIEAFANGAEIQYYFKSKGEWIDIENPIWDYYSEYRIKPTKIVVEDCSFNEREYKLNRLGSVIEVAVNKLKVKVNKIKSILFKDKEIAEAYAVLPQLIRLRDEYNKGWKPDWEDKDTAKYYIGKISNDWDIGFSYKYPQLLSFKSFEIRDEFLKDHRDLIEIAKPLL